MKNLLFKSIISSLSTSSFIIGFIVGVKELFHIDVGVYPFTYFIILFLITFIVSIIYLFAHNIYAKDDNTRTRNIARAGKIPEADAINIILSWNYNLISLLDRLIEIKHLSAIITSPLKVLEVRLQNSELVFVLQGGSNISLAKDIECSLFAEERGVLREIAILTTFNIQDTISSARISEFKDIKYIDLIRQTINTSGTPYTNAGLLTKLVVPDIINNLDINDLTKLKDFMHKVGVFYFKNRINYKEEENAQN